MRIREESYKRRRGEMLFESVRWSFNGLVEMELEAVHASGRISVPSEISRSKRSCVEFCFGRYRSRYCHEYHFHRRRLRPVFLSSLIALLVLSPAPFGWMCLSVFHLGAGLTVRTVCLVSFASGEGALPTHPTSAPSQADHPPAPSPETIHTPSPYSCCLLVVLQRIRMAERSLDVSDFSVQGVEPSS